MFTVVPKRERGGGLAGRESGCLGLRIGGAATVQLGPRLRSEGLAGDIVLAPPEHPNPWAGCSIPSRYWNGILGERAVYQISQLGAASASS